MRDVKTLLIINTLSREKYNELCSDGKIEYEQLYLVEDNVLDAFNKRIVNVATPLNESDAITKDYADTLFVKINDIRSYIDNSKLYSINSTEYLYGTVYVNGKLEVYEKQSNPQWNIVVNAGNVQPNEVTLTWTGEKFGWRFDFKGLQYFGTNKTEIADISRVQEDGYDIVAYRIWPKIDSYISKKLIYSKLSSITKDSSLVEIATAIENLNAILSTYNS